MNAFLNPVDKRRLKDNENTEKNFSASESKVIFNVIDVTMLRWQFISHIRCLDKIAPSSFTLTNFLDCIYQNDTNATYELGINKFGHFYEYSTIETHLD